MNTNNSLETSTHDFVQKINTIIALDENEENLYRLLDQILSGEQKEFDLLILPIKNKVLDPKEFYKREKYLYVLLKCIREKPWKLYSIRFPVELIRLILEKSVESQNKEYGEEYIKFMKSYLKHCYKDHEKIDNIFNDLDIEKQYVSIINIFSKIARSANLKLHISNELIDYIYHRNINLLLTIFKYPSNFVHDYTHIIKLITPLSVDKRIKEIINMIDNTQLYVDLIKGYTTLDKLIPDYNINRKIYIYKQVDVKVRELVNKYKKIDNETICSLIRYFAKLYYTQIKIKEIIDEVRKIVPQDLLM